MDLALKPHPTDVQRPAALSPRVERLLNGAGAPAMSGGAGFAGALSKQIAGPDGASQKADGDADNTKERFRAAARELVGMTFVLPILKMARQDPFKTELFHGGQGEEMFGARFDELMANQIASRLDTGLGDAIYRKFTGQGALYGGLDRHG
ncbi:MAG: rod-binding protein [Planctomycetota bacterium]|jgi:hypothetical protein